MLRVALDKLRKLARTCRHSPFILLLVIVLLGLMLELLDYLVLLAKLEVELSELVLQDDIQATILGIG